MPKTALSQSFIDGLILGPNETKCDYFDTKTTGLVVQILKSGRKTFYLRYQDKRGKTVQKKLGNAAILKLAQVREVAIKYLAQVAMGEDPFVDQTLLKAIPKLSVFIEEQYLPYIKTYKRSWKDDVGLIANHINPNFGELYMDELSKQAVVQFINEKKRSHAPGSINRVIVLLRYIYNLAIAWETVGITKNPTKGIPLLKTNARKERYLSGEEAKRLIESLQQSDNSMLQFIVPMLILTGARKNEVLYARWEDFNLEQRIWRIPMSKSGKARHVPISDGVLRLLDSMPRKDDCPWMFANPKTGKPYKSIFNSWHTARKKVGLSDVRVHDLRHSFASFLVNSGRSLYEVQKILGHSQISTTQRYAHLSNDSLLSAANVVERAIPILNKPKVNESLLIQTASYPTTLYLGR